MRCRTQDCSRIDILTFKIDWRQTQAFAYGYMGRVFINKRSQYPTGTVDEEEYKTLRSELIGRFELLTHPKTGEAIVDQAIPGEELYTGPCSSEAPDLLLVPDEWRYLMYGDFGDEWTHPPVDRAADHHPDGIFIAAGIDATAAELDAEVADIAPTLLRLHDLPLIKGMDGTSLQSVVGNGDAKHEIRPPATFRDSDSEASEASEVAEDRLEDLGYL
jgi:predicted AlkP superfamily phosphohydrolase/phosphomutase